MINLIENIKYFFMVTAKKLKLWFSRFKKLEFFQYMIIMLCVAGFIFLLSFVLFIADKGIVSRRIFFYPDTFTLKLRGEERFLKSSGSSANDIKKVVEELLLGPVAPDVLRVFPQGTKLISMILKDHDLYLNLSEEMLLEIDTMPFPFEKSILSCINTIRFNFPELKKIYFFIHGQELAIQIQDKNGEKIPLENVGYSINLLQ